MRALVLSGGGSKGAFQLGVLKKLAISEANDYEILVGVSVGALSVAGLGMFPYGRMPDAIEWLENFWLEKVGPDNIYKRWFPFGKLHSLWKSSIYDSRPLQNLVRSNYFHEKLVSSNRMISVGAVCLESGEHRYVDQTRPDFVEWILASSCYPVFFEPIPIDGQMWSDGGLKSVTPLGQAIRLGADDIDVIMTCPIETMDSWDSRNAHAVPDHILRVLDLMNEEIILTDIQVTGLKNDLADLSDKYKHVRVRLFYPHQSLGDGLNFDKDLIKKNIQIGFDEADLFEILD